MLALPATRYGERSAEGVNGGKKTGDRVRRRTPRAGRNGAKLLLFLRRQRRARCCGHEHLRIASRSRSSSCSWPLCARAARASSLTVILTAVSACQ